jgi:hypothetical protein
VRPISADLQAADVTKTAMRFGMVSAEVRNEKSQSILLQLAFRAPLKGSTVALLDFEALDITASQFSMANWAVHFELVGNTSTAIFKGTLAGDAIHGTWKEEKRSVGFELKRTPASRERFYPCRVFSL